MTLLRLPEVVRISGYSRSMLYALIAQGLYPKPIKIGERAVAWLSNEVQRMVEAVVSQATSEKRRELVRQLESDRRITPDSEVRGD